jgi:hypothetical protein
MHLRTLAAAASTAAVLAFAAPAMALTVTLDVDVTSATGVANFTPFSFQETWTFSPTDTVNPGTPGPSFLPPSMQTRHESESFSGSPATTTGSPLTAGLLTVAGFSNLDGGVSHVNYSRNTVFDGADTEKSNNSDVEFFNSLNVTTDENDNGTPADPTDDSYLAQGYRQTIEGNGNAAQTPAGMTDAAFAAYLAAIGPMSWSESASQQLGGIFEGGPPAVILGSESYFGTATLVAGGAPGVPEPAAWTLMLLGFGGAGAMLRRRRAALTA